MIKRIMFKGINYFTNRMLTLFIDNINHFNLLSELRSKINDELRLNNTLSKRHFNELLQYVGNTDPSILRINHQVMMLKRKKLLKIEF